MANPPPPYDNITGISRAAMKDNAQVTLAGYDGNARPGEIVVNLAVDPPTVFVGNNAGELTQLSTGGTYGNANVVTLLADFGSNTIDTTGAVTVGSVTLINNARIKDTSGDAVAFGVNAGETSQGDFSVAIGYLAGETSQGADAVAIGETAGTISQGAEAIAIGYNAGANTQGTRAVAISIGAGQTGQGGDAIAIGYNAGTTSQGNAAVAIGQLAGQTSQNGGAIAIGFHAGLDSQSISAVAIGGEAGQSNQGQYAVAIGDLAGNTSQGLAAVAIGALAGETSQGNNSIIINATNAALNQTTANTFTVKPVRAVASVTFAAPTSGSVPAGFFPMYYNPTTGEIIVITT